MSGRLDSTRLAVRKLLRDARDKNKWRKIIRFRLWMPVVLQLLLIVAVAWYTELAVPRVHQPSERRQHPVPRRAAAVVAMGQTHALLVGYLDLSVGAMVTLGVVIASFLIGPESTPPRSCRGRGHPRLRPRPRAGQRRPGPGTQDPVDHRHAGHAQHPGRDLADPAGDGPGRRSIAGSPRGSTARIGPFPIAFIGVVAGAVALDYWLHASGSGLQLRSAGFDERSAKRSGVRTDWIRVRALVLSAAARRRGVLLRHGPLRRSGTRRSATATRSQHHGRGARRGRALRGRATFIGAAVASVLLALIINALPFLASARSTA